MKQLINSSSIATLIRDIDSMIIGLNLSPYLALPYPAIDKDSLMNIEVIEYSQGYGLLSVSLPEPMIRGFVALLEGYHEVWRGAQFKTKCAKAEKKAIDPVEIEKREKKESEYKKAILATFDDFISQGVSAKEAVKETNKALKDRFPGSDYYLVFSTLSAEGRLKGTGFYKKA